MMELGLINPEHKEKGKMLHNDSHKFESTFVGLTIPTNRSVMFGSLSGSKLSTRATQTVQTTPSQDLPVQTDVIWR